MITMITIAPKLMNMGCSSRVAGLKTGCLIRLIQAPGAGGRAPGAAFADAIRGSAVSATS
jgi:hypothetical protein